EIDIDHIAGDPGAEDVTDPLVEDGFRRNARVHAADDRGKGRLARCGGLNLGENVAVDRFAGEEALVALLELGDGFRRHHGRLAFGCGKWTNRFSSMCT